MINLIWPPRCLHPNSRTHWAVKAKAAAEYREYAALAARSAGVQITWDGQIEVFITWFPPSKRRYDYDGLLSNLKAGLDGIADALGVDDYRFHPHLNRGEPIKGGGIKIELLLQ